MTYHAWNDKNEFSEQNCTYNSPNTKWLVHINTSEQSERCSYKKYLNSIKKGIIYGEKIRNSGNFNYDYTHSFLGKDF